MLNKFYNTLQYFTIAILISSCGCRVLVGSVEIDESAMPYVMEFEHTFKTSTVVAISINDDFAFNNEKEIGHCSYGAGKPKAIHIRKSWWDKSGELDREQLIFHEMGHCVFGLAHSDYYVDYTFGGPAVIASIMNTTHIPAYIYRKYHEQYMKEMYLTIYGTTAAIAAYPNLSN